MVLALLVLSQAQATCAMKYFQAVQCMFSASNYDSPAAIHMQLHVFTCERPRFSVMTNWQRALFDALNDLNMNMWILLIPNYFLIVSGYEAKSLFLHILDISYSPNILLLNLHVIQGV